MLDVKYTTFSGENEEKLTIFFSDEQSIGDNIDIEEDHNSAHIVTYNGEIIEFDDDFGIDEENPLSDITIRYDQNLDQTFISLNTDDYQINDFVTIDGQHDIFSAQFDGDDFQLSLGNTSGPIYLSEDDDEFTGATFAANTIYGLGGNDDLTGGNLDDVKRAIL